MAKESKHRRDERKKPLLTLKERRAKKQEKKNQRFQSPVNDQIIE